MFHKIEFLGVKFYSRECHQFRCMIAEAHRVKDVPEDEDLVGFVLLHQAEFLYRAEPQGRG